MIRTLDQVAWMGNGQMLVQSFAGAVRLVRETGKPIAQIARDLGVNAGTRRRRSPAEGEHHDRTTRSGGASHRL
jgi:hypothetical protein